MNKVYMYVVDRDFGFAPNPFHGYCTLATCKPGIRSRADVGDWVLGMGGCRLGATGRCLFAMCVTNKITFNDYWSDPEYLDKKPVRNGSNRMLVGDNIYHYDSHTRKWHQADSHHSNPDGSVNLHNLRTDTKSDKVLVSQHYFYFGSKAPAVPKRLLDAIGFTNGRNYRVFDAKACVGLIQWLHTSYSSLLNTVGADPFDFHQSDKRYSAGDNKVH
jgi:hypothetical protein